MYEQQLSLLIMVHAIITISMRLCPLSQLKNAINKTILFTPTYQGTSKDRKQLHTHHNNNKDIWYFKRDLLFLFSLYGIFLNPIYIFNCIWQRQPWIQLLHKLISIFILIYILIVIFILIVTCYENEFRGAIHQSVIL